MKVLLIAATVFALTSCKLSYCVIESQLLFRMQLSIIFLIKFV